MKDNLDWVHHDSKTVNENYYQVLEGTRSYGKTYGSINEINVNNIIIERNKAVKEIERLNNIINELEAWIKSADEHYPEAIPFRETLRKLKELKESGNNEG